MTRKLNDRVPFAHGADPGTRNRSVTNRSRSRARRIRSAIGAAFHPFRAFAIPSSRAFPLSSAATLLVLTAMPLAAQEWSAANRWPEFTSAFDGFMREEGVIGGSAVLLRDGKVVARHDAGMGDREAGQAAGPETIYHWGSITKTLTAVAIMQLRDRGQLSLDDPITRWVPELRRMHDPFGSMDSVTIRMLLSHTSGFQDPTWPYGNGHAWEPFEPTRWEQLVSMMPYQQLHFRPGSRYGYSNPAFIYLARVIESITGDPYQSWIQKNIWTPLGMTRSYFGSTPYHLAEHRANSYTTRRDSSGVTLVAQGRDFDPGITIPNGGWNAPLDDLAAWAAFLLGAEPGDSARARRYDGVLSRASLAEMWEPVVQVKDGEEMGLSFFVYERNGTPLIGHTGQQAGFRSFLVLNRERRTAVIASTNTINYARGRDSSTDWLELLDAGLAFLVR